MTGPPVLLLHGLATSAHRTWHDNGWIDLLADAGREVVAPDLLGHGDAPKPYEPAGYADLEDAVVEQLPDGELDAIGFSLGARTLLAIAARHPERFRKIVTAGVGANLFRDDSARGAMIRAALSGEPEADNPTAAHFAALADSPEIDRDALAALLRSPRPPLGPEQYAAITMPVLVVLGDQDFAGPPDPLVEALPDASLLVLRGVDHFATPRDFGFIEGALEFIDAQPF